MRNLKNVNIDTVLFLDIETVPKWRYLKDAPEHVQKEWIYKFKYRDGAPTHPDEAVKENTNYDQPYFYEKYEKYFADLWLKKAGFFAEFSKIVCISAGFLMSGMFRLKSYYQENEADLLTDFRNDMQSFNAHVKGARLCAHYGKGFDFPFIAKRMIIHRMQLPPLLDGYGTKPWDSFNLDTQEIWKLGGFGDSATIGSIAMAFGIPFPKDDIGGAEVASCYYNGEIDRIVTYCEKDTVTLASVFKFMRGEEIIKPEQIQKAMI